MKILKIVLENLNSLAGRWEIDLTAPEFRDGIFLISGETGAGKTTILDAVTLALFGATPRVDVSNAHNEAMTRGARHCGAQVEFSCADGVFRASWSQRRAGDGAKIPFDAVKRSLEMRVGSGWKDLPGTPKELLDRTRKLVGAERFEQFLRTAMLAQGKFDQFLSAKGAKDKEERSQILEQATGTEVYSNIGRAIHRRASAAKGERDALVQADKGARSILLSDEDRAGKEVERDRKEAEAGKLAADILRLEEEKKWHSDWKAFEDERTSLEGEAARLKEEWDVFAPVEARAAKAREARALDRFRSAAAAAKAAFDAAAKTAQDRALALERALRSRERTEAKDQAAKASESAARNRQANLQGPIAQAEALDREVSGLVPSVSAARAAHRAAEAAALEARRILAEGKSFVAEEERLADECQARMDEPSPALAAARLAMAEAKAVRDGALERKRVVDVEHENRHKDLDKAVEEARGDLLEAETAKTYEEKRRELEDGRPCPLCGATDHPYCAGHLPQPDKFRRRLEEAQSERDGLVARRDAARKAFEKADEAFRDRDRECRDLDERVREEKIRLREAVAAHRANAKARRELMDSAEAALPGLEHDLLGKAEELKRQEDRLAEVRNRRQALGLADDLDALRGKLQKAVDDAAGEAASRAAAAAMAATAAELAARETERAERALEEAGRKFGKARGDFDAALRTGGWADEAAWETARWDEVSLENAERRRSDLKSRQDGLDALRKTHEARRRVFENRTPSMRPATAVAAEWDAKTAAEKDARNALATIEAELRNDGERRREVDKLAARIRRLSEIAGEWDVLDKELGGENGKYFKEFAQGITLSRLVRLGNKYLVPMTNGRYEMVWDPDGGDAELLLPSLVDRRAGGERRPVFNLSGGERFQVSLSLALGLSDLNAGNLQVETLFLDEGFGTLDEKALDIAIATLETVQRDGSRSIGIISHVRALDDRLMAKIVAKKRGAGRSELSGPCVRRLPPTDLRRKPTTKPGSEWAEQGNGTMETAR